MKILFIGAHFDDIELGCAGTMLRHKEGGNECYLAVLHKDEFRTGSWEIRFDEQYAVLQKIKIQSYWTFFTKNSATEIISELDRSCADLIYLPWRYDTHQAHVYASAIGLSLTRKGADYLYYDSGSAVEFHPNYFVKIDWPRKKEILDCFKSQKDHMKIRESNIEEFVIGRLTWK